jgi:hypothetical protein
MYQHVEPGRLPHTASVTRSGCLAARMRARCAQTERETITALGRGGIHHRQRIGGELLLPVSGHGAV